MLCQDAAGVQIVEKKPVGAPFTCKQSSLIGRFRDETFPLMKLNDKTFLESAALNYHLAEMKHFWSAPPSTTVLRRRNTGGALDCSSQIGWAKSRTTPVEVCLHSLEILRIQSAADILPASLFSRGRRTPNRSRVIRIYGPEREEPLDRIRSRA